MLNHLYFEQRNAHRIWKVNNKPRNRNDPNYQNYKNKKREFRKRKRRAESICQEGKYEDIIM